jgi:hypothetical protein
MSEPTATRKKRRLGESNSLRLHAGRKIGAGPPPPVRGVDREPRHRGGLWRPQGDSNPRYRRERAVS